LLAFSLAAGFSATAALAGFSVDAALLRFSAGAGALRALKALLSRWCSD
jgi:hypothetical protein